MYVTLDMNKKKLFEIVNQKHIITGRVDFNVVSKIVQPTFCSKVFICGPPTYN